MIRVQFQHVYQELNLWNGLIYYRAYLLRRFPEVVLLEEFIKPFFVHFSPSVLVIRRWHFSGSCRSGQQEFANAMYFGS